MSKGIRKHKPSLSQVAAIWLLPLLSSSYTRKNAQVAIQVCKQVVYKSVHKLSTSCVRTACSQLLEQVWNKLLTTCNKLDGIIRLVTKLFLASLIQS